MKTSLLALCTLLIAGEIHAKHRALLIGINDYTASRLGTPAPGTPPRDWVTLNGAVNDVETLKQMLLLVYGVDPGEIVTLTDQAATRGAILQSLQRLVASAAKGDVILFYFAGHGSQRTNSLSDERDKLDESIVPADSPLGVDDIRDKELRVYFNRILDRGARLTVILDNCHSGSGARGLANGARSRGVKRDLRDIADRTKYGPRPEARGALVLSAADDTEEAREMRDAEGKFHGIFSWAWIRSLRDASSGEPAVETFLRAQARMRTEPPFQSPVIAGNPESKLAPFLGTRIDRRGDRTVVAVGKIQSDSVVLQGGWANGLAAGTELRDPKSATRLKITEVRGLGQSIARVIVGPRPETGALVEVVGWVSPPGPPLRVSMPRDSRAITSIASFAKGLNAEATRRGIRWVANPIDATPSHVLRWGGSGWEMVGPRGAVEDVGNDDAVMAAVAKMTPGISLFVQLPAPTVMADVIDTVSAAPDEADYILVGRYANQQLKYAWLRPLVKRRDQRQTGLPLQTKWTVSAPDLHKALTRLRKIHAWHTLESPPQARFPYRLQIRRMRDERLVGDGESIVSDVTYKLYLRGVVPLPPAVKKRYVYAFVVDSDGKSTLLFPASDSGSVENRFPDNGGPMDIPLQGSGFEAADPFGVDTYFLLSTDEPLPNPNILEWEGVRAPQWKPQSALEELLALTAAGTRSQSVLTPATWSLERVTYESIRSRATKTAP
ncbi:MAG: caspase family protein [Acidobacteriota bacterium]